jgi:hypothetical protein
VGARSAREMFGLGVDPFVTVRPITERHVRADLARAIWLRAAARVAAVLEEVITIALGRLDDLDVVLMKTHAGIRGPAAAGGAEAGVRGMPAALAGRRHRCPASSHWTAG